MKAQPTITATILAGGRSSRMGSDKGLVMWKGKPLAAHVIKTLRKITRKIHIVANKPAYAQFGYPVYPDLVADKGPLGGVLTALYYSETERNIIVSCDTPLITVDLINTLILSSEGYDVCIPAVLPDHLEPLIGIYSKRCLDSFRHLVENDQLKMDQAIRTMNHRIIQIDPAEAAKVFLNINTKEDLLNAS